MDKKIILIAAGTIPSSVLAEIAAKHVGHEIIIRTPEEHAELSKQEKVFERPPIRFEAPELFQAAVPYFGGSTSPIDAIGKKNKWGKHKF